MNSLNSYLVVIGWVGVLLFAAKFCRSYFPEQKELSRKIVHIGTGPVVPFAWWIGIPAEVAIIFAGMVTVGLLINHRLQLIKALESVNRQSYGTIFYGLSITVLIALFWDSHPAAVSSGVLVMAFADGFAGLIGRQVNSPNWVVLGQRKSLAGTLTMFVMSALILLLTTFTSSQTVYPLQIIMISLVVTSLEQIGPWGVDNISVPIGVAYGWIWIASS